MVIQIFYTPDITIKPELSGEEARHCMRVPRLGEGDKIVLMDGQDSFYRMATSRARPKYCEMTLLESWKQPNLWNFNLHMAVAPIKNMDRMEWSVEKVTEMGIGAITCLNRRLLECREIKPIRLEKILVNTMKQSQKVTLPALGGMTDFRKFVITLFDRCKLIVHCEKDEKPLLKHMYQPGENALILIGPEGDFSLEEIKPIQESGFESISLGEGQPRTEAAAPAVRHTTHVPSQQNNPISIRSTLILIGVIKQTAIFAMTLTNPI